MNEILSSQVHEHIFGGDDDENNNLNGPRRLLAENLDHQQMELTTEDREDHTFNGKRSCCVCFLHHVAGDTNWMTTTRERTLKRRILMRFKTIHFLLSLSNPNTTNDITKINRHILRRGSVDVFTVTIRRNSLGFCARKFRANDRLDVGHGRKGEEVLEAQKRENSDRRGNGRGENGVYRV